MTTIGNEAEMQEFGRRIGGLLHGGELIELVGDVGAGKTTLVRGIARGMGIDEAVQSPSFTINRVYDVSGKRRLVHYDFYRLNDAGIMAAELDEALHEPDTVVVIEWAGAVDAILPADHLTVRITTPSPETREVTLDAGGEKSVQLKEKIS